MAKICNKKVILVVFIIIAFTVVFATILANTPAARIRRQLSLGDKYLSELKFEDAIYAYEAALAIDALTVKAYVGEAEAYSQLGRFPEAYNELVRGAYLTSSPMLQEEYLDILDKERKNGKRIKKEIIKYNNKNIGEMLYYYDSKGFLEKIRADYHYVEKKENSTETTDCHYTRYYSDYDTHGKAQLVIDKYDDGSIIEWDEKYTYYDYCKVKEHFVQRIENGKIVDESRSVRKYEFDDDGYLLSSYREGDAEHKTLYDKNGAVISTGSTSYENDEFGYCVQSTTEYTYIREYEIP